MNHSKTKIFSIAFVMLMLLSAPAVSATALWGFPTTQRNDESIYEVIASDARFSHIAHAVRRSGLQPLLHQNGKFTVFAPTNRAFGDYPAAMIEATIANADRTQMRQAVLYHIVSGEQSYDDLVNNPALQTALGEHLRIGNGDGRIILNGTAKVRWERISAENGTIYIIDTVLVPPSAR